MKRRAFSLSTAAVESFLHRRAQTSGAGELVDVIDRFQHLARLRLQNNFCQRHRHIAVLRFGHLFA